MGIFKCEHHGYQAIAQLCEHVAEAMGDSRTCDAVLVIDGWRSPVRLCADCMRDVAPTLDGDGQAPDDISLATEVACSECLAEWMRANGLGENLEQIWMALQRLAAVRIVQHARERNVAECLQELRWLCVFDNSASLRLVSPTGIAVQTGQWTPVEVACPDATSLLGTISDFISSLPLAGPEHTDEKSSPWRLWRIGIWYCLATSSLVPAPTVTVRRPPQSTDGDAVLSHSKS